MSDTGLVVDPPVRLGRTSVDGWHRARRRRSGAGRSV